MNICGLALLTLFLATVAQAGTITNTVRDEFNAVAYTNQDGTVNWDSNWEEIGEATDPSAGNMTVLTLWNSYGIRVVRWARSAWRQVNLRGIATNAVLSFDYRRYAYDAGEYARVMVSSNGGDTWDTIDSIEGSGGTDSSTLSTNYDITAYISSNTAVQIGFTSTYGNGESFGADNIQILFTYYEPSAPNALAATNITTVSFYANWNAATTATNYLLDVSTNSGFSSYVSGYNNRLVGNVLTYGVTGLTSQTMHYYRLRAQNNPATSTNSATIDATTLGLSLAVSGNGVNIADGDTTPSLADHTDFGDVLVDSETLTRTYTITNQGGTELTVDNVTTSGAQAADFVVTVQPSSPVAPSDSTTFQVRFDPSAAGTRTAELSFGNSDAYVNPFNFTIQGTGTMAPEMLVLGTNGEVVTNGEAASAAKGTDFGSLSPGQAITNTFSITNGGATLTISSWTTNGAQSASFSVLNMPSTVSGVSNFAIVFAPQTEGMCTAAVSIVNTSTNTPYVLYLKGMSLPASTVTNLNEGFEGTWSGGAPAGWTKEIVGGALDWVKATGGYSSHPAGAHGGSYNALLYIGSTTPNTTRLISPTVDLSSAVSATMTFWHAQALWPSDQDFLRVYYRTNATGAWNLLAEYTTDIPSWTERTFTLTNLSSSYQVCFEGVAKYGYGVVLDDVRVVSEVEMGMPEMTVLGTNGAVVVNGEGASAAKGTDFGSHLWSLPVTNVFTVTNSGSGTLTIFSSTTNGTGASAFRVLNMPASIASSNSATFAVQFAPGAGGTFTAAVSIVNTSTNTPFELYVSGTGLTAALAVSGNGVEIGDGDAIPSLADHTDFGDVMVSGGTLTRTYTITNQGATERTVSNVTISGAQSADFAVTLQPSSPVASSNSTTFTVRFDPSVGGTRTAELSFGNSDEYVNPFNFTIQGTGTVVPVMLVLGTNGQELANGEPASVAKGTDFGSLSQGQAITNTFSITNGAVTALTISGWTTNGAQSASFSVLNMPSTVSGVSSFAIVFSPQTEGACTASVSIVNNSTNTPYVLYLKGMSLPSATVTNLNEGFEGTWSGGAPAGWTKEIVGGALDWIQYTGGYGSQPAGAHSGSYNALLFIGSRTPNTTRMISPTVDLSSAISATMTFWHAQSNWSGDQDDLQVYYRTNATGAWILLAAYSNNIPSWTERAFTLTNLSSSYQVCFEGVAKWGWGVCLDDVRVVTEIEVGTPEMTVLGTNGAVVVNSEGASVAKGTD
ncbi:MAG: choice-of-anchor D domain-containing protein, partial [bacterium]